MNMSNADTCNSLVYAFDNQAFFPIDGRGFGNDWEGHNFGFTFKFSGRFVYAGTEYFSFTGDDDVFVFINDQLAIDLGGVHSAESASIDLTYPSGGKQFYIGVLRRCIGHSIAIL
jgi:fibro-slime domain-containing protein